MGQEEGEEGEMNDHHYTCAVIHIHVRITQYGSTVYIGIAMVYSH